MPAASTAASICEWCSATFEHPAWRERRFCSRYCDDRSRRREDRLLSPALNEKGYICGWVWEGGRRAKRLEHRFLMEQHLGRELRPGEVVHHINGNPADNRLENLRLYSSMQEHHRVEHQRRRPRPTAAQLEAALLAAIRAEPGRTARELHAAVTTGSGPTKTRALAALIQDSAVHVQLDGRAKRHYATTDVPSAIEGASS